MSLDGAFLHIVKTELINGGFIGGRTDKIHQPSKDEIVISIRTGGGIKKLMLSANPSQARLHILNGQSPENPKAPPMFCMLLRKHLSGGKLLDIKQDGLERIIDFHFECMNEMGDIVINRLVIEIMGRSSNIILLGFKDGVWRVTDSLKRVTDEISSVRRVLPNIVYELPPKPKRLLLFDFSEDEFFDLLKTFSDKRADKALLAVFEGISPIFARECVYYAARDLDISVSELLGSKHMREKLIFFLKKSRDILQSGGKPVIAAQKNGKPVDFCFINIEQYGNAAVITEFLYDFPANSLLDKFYGSKAESERARQRSGYLLKMLMNSYERVSRKIEAQKNEIDNCKKRGELKTYGDIINANIYAMQKGAEYLEAENYITGKSVKITLDKKLSPSQNAQKYYSEYRKLDTAEKVLSRLIIEGEEELKYIDSVFDAASRAAGDRELSEIKAELIETGYIKNKGPKNNKKQEKALPPMNFISSDGAEILVGRNNKQNDKLTLKIAAAADMWLHTQNIAGSHVIVKNDGNALSAETLKEAAIIAAYCSKARNGSRVPVAYTLVKYVKKPAGAKPGMVIFTNNKTLFVTPDEEIYKGLQKKQEGKTV